MDYGVGIAGLSIICGLLALVAPILILSVLLERMKGPDDRGFSL